MQREELAAAVYDEVLRRLVGQQADVAVGGPWPGWQPFAGQTAERTNRALVVQLAPQALARLAQGQAQGAEEVFLPVSYTHLDVYKRQDGGCAPGRAG